MCHPKIKVLTQELVDDNPFSYMKIRDISILDQIKSRSPCAKCSKSRKYFCYTCYIPIDELKGKLPKVKLPFKIDIIKHKQEIDGKSTAIHAAILAPDDVTIYTYPNIPEYNDTSKTVLIFPSNNALNISQLYKKHLQSEQFRPPSPEQLQKGYNRCTLLKSRLHEASDDFDPLQFNLSNLPIEKAVFIDSTWNQSKGIYKDSRINKLQCIVLQNRVSQFWRHQKDSPRWYLATIEAIHQFAVEMHINAWGYSENYEALEYIFNDLNSILGKKQCNSENSLCYNGQYDNLLYFFKYMYEKIHQYYSHMELKAYQRPL